MGWAGAGAEISAKTATKRVLRERILKSICWIIWGFMSPQSALFLAKVLWPILATELRAHLDTTPVRPNEPLSLTLSPPGGARETAKSGGGSVEMRHRASRSAGGGMKTNS
jgi:hypothetical protein